MSYNPAHDPSRPWREGYVDPIDVRLFVRTIRGRCARLLLELVKHPGVDMDAGEIAAAMETDPGDVPSLVDRINKYSEAYGHLPLIVGSAQGFRVDGDPATVFTPALQEGSEEG